MSNKEKVIKGLAGCSKDKNEPLKISREMANIANVRQIKKEGQHLNTDLIGVH